MKALFAAFVVLALAMPSVASAQMGCELPDEIVAHVQDGLIVVGHQNATYNCCPDEFLYEVSEEDDVIRVWEHEIRTYPCACVCCYMLGVTIDGVAPGEYRLEFHWLDYGTGAWVFETLPITVPPGPPPGRAGIVDTYSSGCLSSPQDLPEPPETSPDEGSESTWGRIKSLFD